MKVLYVDLEREWRGGQSLALLTLLGMREQELQVELVAACDSPLATRCGAFGLTGPDSRWKLLLSRFTICVIIPLKTTQPRVASLRH